MPAWSSLKQAIAPALKSGDASACSGRNRMLARQGLVLGQVALSVVLLVISGMLIDAFRRMLILDPGIRTTGVMMVELDPSLIRYTAGQTRQFYTTLVERARQLPGVEAAALSSAIPFRPNFSDEQVVPEGYDFPPGQTAAVVSSSIVDASYFSTMGVVLLQGRAFASTESRPVAIVNQEFVRRYWPGQEALGKQIRIGANQELVEVVGVARTGKYLSLAELPQPYLYLPFPQRHRSRMTLLVQTEADAVRMAGPILELVRSLDPNQPVYNVRDLQTYYEQGVLGIALTAMQVVWAMGLTALLLASFGLYGVISFSVARRRREIGIRMAIGADRSRIRRLFLKQGLSLAAIGTAVGIGLAIPAFRAASAGLAGLGTLSAWTLAIVPACLIAVALAAACIPAWHASRINPNVVLRLD
jgi:predicted permease